MSELIDQMGRSWREQLVRQSFSHAQADEILSIPLSNTEMQDKLMWGCTKDGMFTVKSATSLARNLEEAKSKPHLPSCSGDFDGRWARLWRAVATPRAKNLCWRACRDALPTCVKLFQRGVEVDAHCPVCGAGYETPSHIFLDCEFAMDFWRKSPFRLNTFSRDHGDFGAWCHNFLRVLDAEQSGLLITLIWGLWTLRNRWVFEKKREKVGTSLERLVGSWRGYLAAMEEQKGQNHEKKAGTSVWLPPPKDVLKVNVDAAIGGDRKRGIGVIVRDCLGETKLAACKRIYADWEVETTEAGAVLHGLQVCREAGHRKIELETDSKTIAEALNRRTQLHNYSSIFI